MDTLLKILRVALGVLTDRLLTILSLWMVFGLSLWAMHTPTWERLGMTGFFALFVYIPALIKERSREVQAPRPTEQAE